MPENTVPEELGALYETDAADAEEAVDPADAVDGAVDAVDGATDAADYAAQAVPGDRGTNADAEPTQAERQRATLEAIIASGAVW